MDQELYVPREESFKLAWKGLILLFTLYLLVTWVHFIRLLCQWWMCEVFSFWVWVWVKEANALGIIVGREVARLFHWCSFCVKIHNERRRASRVHIIGGGVDHKGFGSMAYFLCLGGDTTFFVGLIDKMINIENLKHYSTVSGFYRSSQVGWT